MYRFICRDCSLVFEESTRTRLEYRDPIYGNCWKYIAHCPVCGGECSEKSDPSPAKSKKGMDQGCGFGNCGIGKCQDFQNFR